jgi:hypothetical protein
VLLIGNGVPNGLGGVLVQALNMASATKPTKIFFIDYFPFIHKKTAMWRLL